MLDNSNETLIHQKIPSAKLIIYRASRFSQFRSNNLKYAYFSPSLEYSIDKHILDLPKKHYATSKISIPLFYSSRLETSYLMRFITKFRGSIRHLSLGLLSDNLATPDSELQIRKVLKRLLKTCSKAKNLHLQVETPFVKTELSWRFLRLIKSFKNFSCTFWSSYETHFENLANSLIKTQRKSSKRTNSFHFNIDSSYDAENDRSFDWISFASSFEILNSKLSNSHFSLKISFNPGVEIKDLFEFAQRCLSFPSLKKLYINLGFFDAESSFKFLNLIQESPDLKTLSLKLKDLYGIARPSFPQHLESLTFKSLAHLHLNFEEIGDSHFLAIFFQTLTLCNTHLSSLSVYSGNAADSVIECLTQSLHKFDKLTSLILNVNPQPILYSKLATPTIRAFYEKLSVLKQLKELNLNFAEQTEAGSGDVFSAFCESLGNLTELKKLALDMNETGFEGDCLIQLANTIPNLDSLVLNCNGFSIEQISGDTFNQFATSLVGLRDLSHLELTLLCENMNVQCAKEIAASFWEIKSLNFLHFSLNVVHCDHSVDNYLKEQMRKLENKIDVFFSFWSI